MIESTFGVEEEFCFLPKFENAAGETFSRLTHAVAASPAVTFDWRAINLFFRTGLYLNGSTPFSEIRRVTCDPVICKEERVSYDDAISTYIALFRTAVARIVASLDGPSAMGLSGGCDSRHILLELATQKSLPDFAVTVRMMSKEPETAIAIELAKRTGLTDHRLVDVVPANAIRDEIWKNEHCDFMSLEHRWFSPVARERDMRPWWDGIAGDVLSAGLFLSETNLKLYRSHRFDELAESLVSHSKNPFVDSNSPFRRDDAVADVRAELVKHMDAANPVSSFYFWNRTRIQIGSSAFGLLRPAGQRTLAPYLDRDVWQFLSSLPAELFLTHEFHRDAVRRAYPEFADISYSASVTPTARRHSTTVSAVMLLYLINAPGSLSGRIKAALRAIRASLVPTRQADLAWIIPAAVYECELAGLQSSISG